MTQKSALPEDIFVSFSTEGETKAPLPEEVH